MFGQLDKADKSYLESAMAKNYSDIATRANFCHKQQHEKMSLNEKQNVEMRKLNENSTPQNLNNYFVK